MFISHFKKWDWIKIYWILLHERKKLIIPISRKIISKVALLVLLIYVGSNLDIFKGVYLLIPTVPIFFIYMIWPLTSIFAFSPTELVCFYSKPSQKKIQHLSKISGMEESVLLKIAEQNILLKPPIPYDIFLNTRNYFILYYPVKEQKAAMLLVIKKKENTSHFSEEQFVNLLQPQCKHYIKKN